MSRWEERVSWTRDAVLGRESSPDLVCKVLESERATEKGGTEGVLDVLGYQGFVGLEYNPTTSSEASFAWLSGDHSGRMAVGDMRL